MKDPKYTRCSRCGVHYNGLYDNHDNCPANLKAYSDHVADVVEQISGKIGYRLTKGFNFTWGSQKP